MDLARLGAMVVLATIFEKLLKYVITLTEIEDVGIILFVGKRDFYDEIIVVRSCRT